MPPLFGLTAGIAGGRIVRFISRSVVLRIRRDGTFISKPALVTMLNSVDDNKHFVLDGTGEFVDHDVKRVRVVSLVDAPARVVKVSLRGIDLAAHTSAAVTPGSVQFSQTMKDSPDFSP